MLPTVTLLSRGRRSHRIDGTSFPDPRNAFEGMSTTTALILTLGRALARMWPTSALAASHVGAAR